MVAWTFIGLLEEERLGGVLLDDALVFDQRR